MNNWRLIVSPPADGPENMGLDEALFSFLAEGKACLPIFRIYSWNARCVTIGYFQKHEEFLYHNLPVTRRLTGGLSVRHGDDVSYAFIARDDHWPHVYKQEETYQLLHSGIKEGLNSLGYKADFYDRGKRTLHPANNICVDTVFPYDVHIGGRKVVGSSQRQRGKTILVQGSIHISGLLKDFNATASAIAAGWERVLRIQLERCEIAPEIRTDKEALRLQKYSSITWNSKV
jgi:lipoate-protein ligase A